MANEVTLTGDMKIYDPRVQAGYMEGLAQNLDIVNRSLGTISITDRRMPGNYAYAAGFDRPANLIRRRDPTAQTAVETKKVTQNETVRVNVSRGIGPAAFTQTAFLRAGLSLDAFLVNFGRVVAEEVIKEQVNTGIGAMASALYQQSASKFRYLTGGNLQAMKTEALADGLALMGDMSDRVVLWVMHSKHFHKLVKEQMAQATPHGAVVINTGLPATINRPYIVTDSPSLVKVTGSGSAAVTSYLTIGLTAGALDLENTEPETIIVSPPQTGFENLQWTYQGEYGYSVAVKGFTWDVANGGANPTNTALYTGTNWDVIFSDMKNRAGIVVEAL